MILCTGVSEDLQKKSFGDINGGKIAEVITCHISQEGTCPGVSGFYSLKLQRSDMAWESSNNTCHLPWP